MLLMKKDNTNINSFKSLIGISKINIEATKVFKEIHGYLQSNLKTQQTKLVQFITQKYLPPLPNTYFFPP